MYIRTFIMCMTSTAKEQHRTYIAIDLKSFYASVECMERGLDPLTTRLVVADASRTDKTICLAVSPALKAYGISGRARLFEVKQKIAEVHYHQPELPVDYIVAKPQMALYIKYSTRIYGIYLRYIAPEDIHVYSIDEVFMDVTDYLGTYKMTAHELAMKMIREVLRETGITATAGIGTNMYLAKVAMDIVAKHIPADKDGVRIAELDEMSYRQKLWHHTPLTSFWRVGRGLAVRMESMGIHNMGQLARYSLQHEDNLYKVFGVNAELLIDHAWGYEPCTMEAIKAYRPEVNSLGSGQVLQCAYTAEKGRTVVMEMADQLALDLVASRRVAEGLTLTVGYDRESLERPDIRSQYTGPLSFDHYGRQVPKPVHGTERFEHHTSSSKQMIDAAMALFDRIVNPHLLMRRLNVTAQHVVSEEEAEKKKHQPRQLELFDDNEAIAAAEERHKQELDKERRMQEALLEIKNRFGKNAILKGVSYKDGATAKERNEQIGGHHA